jgi:hypothetical protein
MVALTAVTAGIVMPPVVASAQAASTKRAPLSLTTSPLPLTVTTQPGKTVTADIRVKNNGTQSEKLKVELLKFHADGVSGQPQLAERGAKDTYFDWVSFSETQFTADPNVWKTIKMTIKTPPSAAFGYYLAVLFSRASPEKPAGGQSGVEGGVASLVLLDVDAPGAKREAKISSLTASKKVYEFLPADFTIKLTNGGNVHVAPTGDIFIKHGGSQVGTLHFNSQQGNILPGSSRTFKASWNDGFPAYETKVEGTKTTRHLKWDFGKLQKFRMGKYTATLFAVYDDGRRDVPVEGTVTFWIIPWRILGVVLLILLLVGAGIFMTFRGLWKGIRRSGSKKDKKAKKARSDRKEAPASETTDESDEKADQDGSGTDGDQKEVGSEPSAIDAPASDDSTSTNSAASKAGSDGERKTAPELKD